MKTSLISQKGSARGAAAKKAPSLRQAQGGQGGALHEETEDFDEDDAVPASVREALGEPGQPLDVPLRRDFEHRLGRDFSQVRVHTGTRAAASARALDAPAYAVGSELVFGAGRYAPRSSEGRWLLAHELAHAAQSHGAWPRQALRLGARDDAEEHEADRAAHAALHGLPPPALRRGAPAVRRAPGTGPGWKGVSGINAKETTIGAIRRVPIDSLAVGQQTGASPSGRAIVLIPATFDPTRSADILLHLHGHNAGYTESAGKVRDEQLDRIETQMEASGRTQLLGILPQGDVNSSFGQQGGKKVFDSDAFITAVLDTLVAIKAIASKPAVGQVVLAGHSGAGELINEKLLGGDPGSSLPSKVGTLKEVALFDAVNGPKEFEALQGFLKKMLRHDLAALMALKTVGEQLALLKTSFRFRAYYSHSKKIGEYYRQWHKGPVPAGARVADPTPIEQLLDDFFKALTLDAKVVAAFRDNYRVVDAGDQVEHDKMVGDSNHLQDALSVLPKHDPAAGALPDVAPPEVHEALRGPARALPAGEREWAEHRFGRSFDGVRIHDDTQASRSARALHAEAYTVGRDIVFGPGRYAPGTSAGRRLLAHELTHVVQQGALARPAPALPDVLPVARASDAREHEAERAEHAPDGAVAAHADGPRVQRAPDKTVDAAMCEANANKNPARLGDCSYKEPENCPTYEMWVQTFTLLKTFNATDTPGTQAGGFTPIGGGAADQDFKAPSTPKQPAPAPTTPLKPGERFIDHPTDQWVKTCLPDNLRATAYQLPADCADVAMILRHVWLAAHHRTETFGKWTLGSAAGKAEEKSVLKMISNEGTGGVAGMVAPYADPATGKPMRSFAKLGPLLHPGDIMVWWHFDNGFDKPRTGGHTHTIAGVQRDPSGKITSLTLLQGNEPLFQPQKDDIHAFLKKEKPKAAQPTDKELGEAPGRRIERTTSAQSGLTLSDLNDMDVAEGKGTVRVWRWGKETLLVAAGPPRAAGQRPPTQPVKGAKGPAPQRLTDWAPALVKASVDRFMGILEGMLYELRATVEGGSAVPEADVRSVGSAAGTHIWARGKAAGDLGNTSHFQRLQDVLDVISAFGSSREFATSPQLDSAYDKITGELLKHLRWLREAFELAARGAADVDFARGTGKGSAVNVLVTGFDPFEPSGSLRRPDPGQWNPSGAAVLALDNQRLPVADSHGHKGTAAVEGIVLPVSFDQFKAGIVEQAVGSHAKELDALLTISMDGRKQPGDPVRLERYAVGVHEIGGKMEGVPAAPGGGALGPAVIESNAPLEQVADATARPAGKGLPAVARPEIGESFVFDFGGAAQARAAQATVGGDLGGTAGTDVAGQPPSRLMVKDSTTVSAIVSTLSRVGSGAQVQFRARQKDFKAVLVEGPGGNFLSNEVSYRAQRLLKGAGSTTDPLSFHVHTPSADAIPQDTSSKEAVAEKKKATSRAMGQRTSLIDTLKRVIGAVAKVILDRRAVRP
ncbi:MAG TPA: DUF4157 domain-containing protein [Albitalea sp.]|nr:DUF4157 domain-containing protein [Albitalea sp.]